MQPYTLISGKRYRLQTVSTDNKILSAQWFLAGNLGRITTGDPAILIAVFVGEGNLVCRVNGMEQSVKLSVVPASKIIGSNGGKLQSPSGVEISFPEKCTRNRTENRNRNCALTGVATSSTTPRSCYPNLT